MSGEPAPAGDTTSNVLYMTVTGTNAAGGTTLSAERDLTALGVVPGFVDPPVPKQPGSSALDPGIIDRRPTDAIWQDNILSFVSTVGWTLPEIVSGDAIVAVVLSLPTTGPLLLRALQSQDMYLAGSFILMLSVLTAIGTLFSDLLLAWLDPRIRLGLR